MAIDCTSSTPLQQDVIGQVQHMQLLLIVWHVAHMQGKGSCHAWCIRQACHEPLLALLDGVLHHQTTCSEGARWKRPVRMSRVHTFHLADIIFDCVQNAVALLNLRQSDQPWNQKELPELAKTHPGPQGCKLPGLAAALPPRFEQVQLEPHHMLAVLFADLLAVQPAGPGQPAGCDSCRTGSSDSNQSLLLRTETGTKDCLFVSL